MVVLVVVVLVVVVCLEAMRTYRLCLWTGERGTVMQGGWRYGKRSKGSVCVVEAAFGGCGM